MLNNKLAYYELGFWFLVNAVIACICFLLYSSGCTKDDTLVCLDGAPCVDLGDSVVIIAGEETLCGVCYPGSFDCEDESCSGFVGPSEEICDGLDNDCNCAVDDGVFRLASGEEGNLCEVEACGACQASPYDCVNGVMRCLNEPVTEACNGLDDDCDCETDEIPVEMTYSGPPATLGIGECAPRIKACIDGVLRTIPESLPVPEECGNQKDDDCDGITDELLAPSSVKSVLLALDYSGSMGPQRNSVIDGICAAALAYPLNFVVAGVGISLPYAGTQTTFLFDFMSGQDACDYLVANDPALRLVGGAIEPQPEAVVIGLEETTWPSQDRAVLVATDEALQENSFTMQDVVDYCADEGFKLYVTAPAHYHYEWTPWISLCGGGAMDLTATQISDAVSEAVTPECDP